MAMQHVAGLPLDGGVRGSCVRGFTAGTDFTIHHFHGSLPDTGDRLTAPPRAANVRAGSGMRSRATFVLACVVVAMAIPSNPARAQAPIFRFETDEFWLNLHKFLYVLGRAQNKSADASRDAVADAPGEADRGLASLTEAERTTWANAVTAYARGPSRPEPIFDRDAALLEGRLADVDDASGVDAANVDGPLRAVLEQAAPVYRKAWWPSHRAANRAWVSATQELVKAHGPSVLQFITRAYQMQWRTGG